MANKISIVALLSILFHFLSCSPKEETLGLSGLSVVDSIIFRLPFSPRTNHMAIYVDSKTHTKWIYFADLYTTKQLIFHSLDGKDSIAINLKNGISALNYSVQDIEVLSMDSILLIAPYTNDMIFLNKDGIVWKYINTNKVLGFDKNTKESYEFFTSLSEFSSIFDNKDLITYFNTRLTENEEDVYEWSHKNKINNWKKPKYIRIRNIGSDSMTYNVGCKLFQVISPNDSNALFFGSIFNYYHVMEDKLVVTNFYSNKIYILDPYTLAIDSTIQIESKYTKFGIPLLSAKSIESEKNLTEKAKNEIQNWGKITSVYFNKYKSHYYVACTTSKNSLKYGNWILMVFDKNFKKLNEFLIDPEIYLAPLIVTKNGFMLKKNVEQSDFLNQSIIMHEFSY